jgi:hypothetical protein
LLTMLYRPGGGLIPVVAGAALAGAPASTSAFDIA